ncbi:MAG TPA: asparagine synthase (glutamine-hydrolyzing) [Candidatus Methylomirabilis sp.]|nr:asparagine synthase (glutamine-hydrolyzing) [Candidatus Methylomirabilis sp.]
MCGIAGFTHKNWAPEPERIERATAALAHRGPDQRGVFRSSVLSMGGARLKIIDLQGGDQPIVTDDGDTAIVFNGEIYNHLELRAELEKLGHRFHSHSDTETVLHAFVEWDTQSFARLRGMFAIALWTKSSRRLVLARDRMGIKPLYIARHGEDLFFGSELKTIFTHPEFQRRLSLNGLACYLSLNYVPGPWTMVEGVEKLAPGQWLEWRDGTVRVESYWTLPAGPIRKRSLDSACEELDSLLQSSAREHLLSDVPLGLWLSGGVDSSTILHYATAASPKPLKTFSISFLGRGFDETEYIRTAAKQYGSDHREFDLSPDTDLRGAIEEFAYYSDEPSSDAGVLPVWFLSKMCRTETTVALSGEGADELFGGYLTYRANQLAEPVRGWPKWLIRTALGIAQRWPVSDEKISREYMLKRFLAGSLMTPERAHVYWNGTFSNDEARSLCTVPLPSSFDSVLAELRDSPAAKDGLPPFLWWDQKYFLPDDILNKVDRMSMAHSLEVRPPFLDHRIVEFAATLPPEFKVQGSGQKLILKHLMRKRLPGKILTRQKMGFDIPAHQWLRGPLKPLLLDTMREAASQESIFRPDVIQEFVRLHLQRRINVGYHLWGLLLLFLWMKKWRIQVAPSPAPASWIHEKTGIST